MTIDAGQVLREYREKKGMTLQQVADEIGVAKGNVSRYENNKQKPEVHRLYVMAELLDIPPRLIADMFAALYRPGQAVQALDDFDYLGEEYIQVGESSVKFSAGNGHKPVFDDLLDLVPATYRLDWFKKEGIKPHNARRFKVHGDSMTPFLYDGDTVLVNLAENEVKNGKVYAMRYGDELRIKRIYKKLDGGLILHSDNPEFLPRDEEIPAASVQQHITIIGRVRDKSGTGGL